MEIEAMPTELELFEDEHLLTEQILDEGFDELGGPFDPATLFA